MPRVRKGAASTRKHKRILRAARGHIGTASRWYRVALQAYLHAGQHATVGRKLRKRDFRQLWITRISAAVRQRGLNYSNFMHGLAGAGVAVNRKMLAELAVSDPGVFDSLVAVARGEALPEAAFPARAPRSEPAATPAPAGHAEASPEEAPAPEPQPQPEPGPEAAAKPKVEAQDKPKPKARARKAKGD